MSPAHVIEPTCKKLKYMLMEGVWPPGEKLEALRLADELGVSMTPVRDCLNRLVGEGLVEMKPGEGYRVPRISEKALRDMLVVNVALLELTLITRPEELSHVEFKFKNCTYADRVSTFFDLIASLSGNIIIIETVRSLNERMHIVRMKDLLVFPDALQEIEELEQLSANQDAGLRSSLYKYHQRRHEKVSTLIDLIQ
ncbi:GntR family transcriptional regulator [Parasphingorhabdus sp. JC815]|uniref:GntR family transcriptional regulator n=1 Tax=Parasphingorhabdus sp. JC815 TaxID=3232140 RepID=UPI0034587343